MVAPEADGTAPRAPCGETERDSPSTSSIEATSPSTSSTSTNETETESPSKSTSPLTTLNETIDSFLSKYANNKIDNLEKSPPGNEDSRSSMTSNDDESNPPLNFVSHPISSEPAATIRNIFSPSAEVKSSLSFPLDPSVAANNYPLNSGIEIISSWTPRISATAERLAPTMASLRARHHLNLQNRPLASNVPRRNITIPNRPERRRRRSHKIHNRETAPGARPILRAVTKGTPPAGTPTTPSTSGPKRSTKLSPFDPPIRPLEIKLNFVPSFRKRPNTDSELTVLPKKVCICHERTPIVATSSILTCQESAFAKFVAGQDELPYLSLSMFLVKHEGREFLETLRKYGVDRNTIKNILGNSGENAVASFRLLYNMWFDHKGKKTKYFNTLIQNKKTIVNVCSILCCSGKHAARAYKELWDLWYDPKGQRTHYLKNMEKRKVSYSHPCLILHKAGVKAASAFRDLYNLWFDKSGHRTRYLKTLKKHKIPLRFMTRILRSSAEHGAKAYKKLFDLLFDLEGNKTKYLKIFEKRHITLSYVSHLLDNSGVNAAAGFKEFYKVFFDKKGQETTCYKVFATNNPSLHAFSRILVGSGAKTGRAFKALFKMVFDKKGNKSKYYMKFLEEQISINMIAAILAGTGVNAAKAFKNLYKTFWDGKGNKTKLLKSLTEAKDAKRNFTVLSLMHILKGTGVEAKLALENLLKTCYNEKGHRTRVFNDFLKAGFNTHCIACSIAGHKAHSGTVLRRLHSICFTQFGKKSRALKLFFKAGFTPLDMSRIMYEAPDNIRHLHSYFFREKKTKRYLHHFLKECFTSSGLCQVLFGSSKNLCTALTDLHDCCFKERGECTPLLNDFLNAGIKPSHLMVILSETGINAAAVLRKLHKSFFGNDNNHLNHFLNRKILFKPDTLAQILHGSGLQVSNIFEKLHQVCFDENGEFTPYILSLVQGRKLKDVITILKQESRKPPTKIAPPKV